LIVTSVSRNPSGGLATELRMGNLDAHRDWGYAGDYVIATNRMHSVKDAIDIAFGHVGLEPERHVTIDPRFLRPAEVEELRGDAGKAERQLGWTPQVGFDELMKMMVDADLERLARLG
jgi:GDPmannose 4,6-dehydratase